MLTAKQDLTKIIFMDLETVPLTDSFFELSEKMQELFKTRHRVECEAEIEKIAKFAKGELERTSEFKKFIEKLWSDKASFSPEFGKIVSIAWGGFAEIGEEYKFRSRNICSDDEKALITQFAEILNKIQKKAGDWEFYLCAHNGKEFDFRFLAKRLIINRIPVPEPLNYPHLKPWEIAHIIDTKEAWNYGSNYSMFSNSSLDIICASLGVESSKTDMNGSKVKEVFYKEKGYKKIGEYCEADVLALATCYLRMKGIYNNVIKQ